MIDEFKKSIDNQLESNHGKNLFHDGLKDLLKFTPLTINAIGRIGEIDKDSENLLIDYVTNKALQVFCKVNQYYSFNSQAKKKLRNIYVQLFANIRLNKKSVDQISKEHYDNLINWLQETNSFAEMIYKSKTEVVEPVACSEYSSDLQIEILQIDVLKITGPVLDIGCGQHGNLVLYLRQNGIEAYGFDRFTLDTSYLVNSDWFEFEYGLDKWGTIISNLGFTNHFKHHHLREDGNFIDFAKKYMDILNSLKIDGSFHYAPNLPFIEQYLDKTKYQLTEYNIGKYDFKATVIKRIK